MTPDRVTSNQQMLAESKRRLRGQFPDFSVQLLDFLERDESTICYAKPWNENLAALRVAPSTAITAQFDITLEIPVLIASFGGAKLEPRVLRHLDTSADLRLSTSADKDIAILISSDPRAHEFVKDRRRFAFPILVIETDRLTSGEYIHTNLRTELSRLLRSVNHFDFSNEIRTAADFFGRLDEIDALTALASAGQSAGIFGLRRAGKTSLLYRVREALQGRGIASIYVQLNAVPDEDGFRGAILRELGNLAAEQLHSADGRLPARPSPTQAPGLRPSSLPAVITPREWVYRMDELLDQIGSNVVVLIDEIDLANEDAAEYDESEIEQRRRLNRVLQQLRGIIQIRNDRGKHRLSFLSAGVAASVFTKAMRFNRDNQLFGFASCRPLQPMSQEEMREMVRTLGKRSGLKFNDYRLFELLFAEYGGHPHLTRKACSVVAETRHTSALTDVPYIVKVEDLQAVFRMSDEGSPADAARETLRSFERWYPEEAGLVMEVARSGVKCAVPAKITHAIGFGLCDDIGGLRMGALARIAQT